MNDSNNKNDNRYGQHYLRGLLVLAIVAAIATFAGLPTTVVHALQTRMTGQLVGGAVGSTAVATALNVDADGNVKTHTTPAMSGYVTDYLSVTTALPSTSQTLTATTTLLQYLRCNNLTASAQTYQITDGNNAYIVGPLHSLGASTFETVVDSSLGIEVASGIKYSSTNNATVRCYFSGRQ